MQPGSIYTKHENAYKKFIREYALSKMIKAGETAELRREFELSFRQNCMETEKTTDYWLIKLREKYILFETWDPLNGLAYTLSRPIESPYTKNKWRILGGITFLFGLFYFGSSK